MKKLLCISLFVISVISFSACASQGANQAKQTEPQNASKETTASQDKSAEEKNNKLEQQEKASGVTHLKSERKPNKALADAVIQAVGIPAADAKKTRYYYNYVDLNDDGLPEIYVQLIGPYTSGSGGDTALIFQQKGSELTLLRRFTIVRNPVIISDNKTNGWRDIITTLGGGGVKSHPVLLRFDGTRYPHPNDGEPIDKSAITAGKIIVDDDFAQDLANGTGLYLQ